MGLSKPTSMRSNMNEFCICTRPDTLPSKKKDNKWKPIKIGSTAYYAIMFFVERGLTRQKVKDLREFLRSKNAFKKCVTIESVLTTIDNYVLVAEYRAKGVHCIEAIKIMDHPLIKQIEKALHSCDTVIQYFQ